LRTGDLKVVLLSTLVFASLLAPLSALMGTAEAGATPNIILRGKATAYNINQVGAPPLKWYKSSPPVMVAAKVGSGAVVAAGIAATCRDNRWNNPSNPDPYLDVLLDKAFQWMKPGATKVLWFEGYGVYNTITTSPVQCANLRDALQAKGYTLTGGATTPITSSLLSGYDILVIPQLELPVTATGTGGDPSLLPDNDVQAIVSFVSGGKGLFIMDGSDYAGHNFSNVQNKILNALGVGSTLFYFQDDQVQDDTNKWAQAAYQPIAAIDTTTDIGKAYQIATGENEIGLYDICSLRIVENHPDVSVTISPTVNVAMPGKTMTFKATIIDIGFKPDNFTITVRDNFGWPISLSENRISLGISGESAQVDVEVTVPSDQRLKVVNWITIEALGDSGAKDNASFRAVVIGIIPPPSVVNPEIPRFLGPNLPTLTVDLPAVPIITAIRSGYSNDLTPREPLPILWGQGEFPPVAAAALVDNGRAVAIANSILRDSYFDRAELSNKEVMYDIAGWMENWGNPEDYKFLYFCTEASLGTYHLPSVVTKWLNLLRGLGFDVDNQVGGEITTKLLENVDILNIAELMRPLSDNEIQTVSGWVRAGGRLIIMCQSDYGGYSKPDYPNELLEALNCPIRFQDDELYDDNSWVIDGPWYPQIYLLDPRQVNPNFDVWFPVTPPFPLVIPVRSLRANNVRVLYPFTITNYGAKAKSYKIEVQETSQPLLGWDVTWWPTEADAAPSESIEGYVTVTVPKIEVGRKRMDLFLTVTDKIRTYLKMSITFATLGDNSITITPAKFENGQSVSTASLGKVTIVNLGYSGGTVGWTYVVQTTSGENKIVSESELSAAQGPGGGFPRWIIAAAIVVIIVVLVSVYSVMLKK